MISIPQASIRIKSTPIQLDWGALFCSPRNELKQEQQRTKSYYHGKNQLKTTATK